MRSALLTVWLVALAACGAPRTRKVVRAEHWGGRVLVPQIFRDYPVTRWIPERPTYAFAARSVRDFQRAAIDAIETAGLVIDVDATSIGALATRTFGIDPLSPAALADVGIDLDGGIAVYSEAFAPTIVVRVADPVKARAFADRAPVPAGLADDWMWIGARGPKMLGVRAKAPAWLADWEWAARTSRPPFAGFVDMRALAAHGAGWIDHVAGTCGALVRPLGRAGFAVTASSDGEVAIRVAFDLGPAAPLVAAVLLPAPAGWDAVANTAPLAAQWNLDLDVARAAIAPCAGAVGLDVGQLDLLGVRAGRAMILSLDPRGATGTGAIALDLSSKRALEGYLDDIPLRSTLESKRTFGPYAGKHLSVPFGPKLDYVLTDRLALAAVGDGVLARVVGDTASPPASGTILGLDLAPGRMSPEAWALVLRLADLPLARRIAQHVQHLAELHLSGRLDGAQIVLEARGKRR